MAKLLELNDIAQYWEPKEIPHPCIWSEANIDYSLAPNYDTPFKSRYSSDLFPFWQQPLSDATNPYIREVVVKKCSRAGGSESFLLNRMRWGIINQPEPTLYITADMESAETFMENRIKRGMNLSKLLSKKYENARQTEHYIRFDDMDLRVLWSKSTAAYRQDGYSLILADEVSCWPGYSPDLIRKRCAMYPFSHILWISSPDPSRKGNPDNDPIIILYNDTNKQQWFMQDENGKEFYFNLDGIKWDSKAKKDDEWDLDLVRESAYYETTSGAIIKEENRLDIMRTGKWKPTCEGKRADVSGYSVTAPMIPNKAGNFGEIATRFLEAKYHIKADSRKADKNHNTLRIYFAEYWGETFREAAQMSTENILTDRHQNYELGEEWFPEDSSHGVYITVDVQKTHIWWLARCWSVEKNDNVCSALVDFGTVATFTELEEVLSKWQPSLVGIDIGYSLRASEVADFCASYTDPRNLDNASIFAFRGNPKEQHPAIKTIQRDASEGRGSAYKKPYMEIDWDTDVFRTYLIEMLNGIHNARFYIPERRDFRTFREYIKQVLSTKKVEGEWIVAKHGQDHMFDLEAMQCALARHDNLI